MVSVHILSLLLLFVNLSEHARTCVPICSSCLYTYRQSNGKIGEQQIKVVWAPEGSTLYYWSDGQGLPVQVLGGLHNSRCTERGIESTGKVGFIDAWIPLEKTGGKAKLHFTAQVEWQYDPDYVRTVMKNNLISSNLATSLKAKAGISKVFKGGMTKRLTRDEQVYGQAAFLSLTGGKTMAPAYFVSVLEARDVGLHGTAWTCSIMTVDYELIGKTDTAYGPHPVWNTEFDLAYESVRVPIFKVVVHKASNMSAAMRRRLTCLGSAEEDGADNDDDSALYEGSTRLVRHQHKRYISPLFLALSNDEVVYKRLFLFALYRQNTESFDMT